MTTIKSSYLLYLSKPAEDRVVYKAIRRNGAARIMEIGLQQGVRARRMIEAASLGRRPDQIHYVGVDPFESRTTHDGPGWSLKEAHRELASTGAHVRLLPGDPGLAIRRVANSIRNLDVIVIATPSLDWLSAHWDFLPRMMSPTAHLLVGQRAVAGDLAEFDFSMLDKAEVEAGPAKLSVEAVCHVAASQ